MAPDPVVPRPAVWPIGAAAAAPGPAWPVAILLAQGARPGLGDPGALRRLAVRRLRMRPAAPRGLACCAAPGPALAPPLRHGLAASSRPTVSRDTVGGA
eukprot:8099272-Lingulodinium_polyedra.AAC.1